MPPQRSRHLPVSDDQDANYATFAADIHRRLFPAMPSLDRGDELTNLTRPQIYCDDEGAGP